MHGGTHSHHVTPWKQSPFKDNGSSGDIGDGEGEKTRRWWKRTAGGRKAPLASTRAKGGSLSESGEGDKVDDAREKRSRGRQRKLLTFMGKAMGGMLGR